MKRLDRRNLLFLIVVQSVAVAFHARTAIAGAGQIFRACAFLFAVARVCIRTLVTDANFGWYFVLGRGCRIRIVVTICIRILLIIVAIYRRRHCPITCRIFFVLRKCTHFDANDDKCS